MLVLPTKTRYSRMLPNVNARCSKIFAMLPGAPRCSRHFHMTQVLPYALRDTPMLPHMLSDPPRYSQTFPDAFACCQMTIAMPTQSQCARYQLQYHGNTKINTKNRPPKIAAKCRKRCWKQAATNHEIGGRKCKKRNMGFLGSCFRLRQVLCRRSLLRAPDHCAARLSSIL